jgi:hypothetical protein
MNKISLTKNPAPASTMFSSETASEQNSESLFLFLFYGTEFRVFSLPRNGSEQNYKSLLLFLFHGTEFREFFSSAEQFRTEFREFSVPRNSRNSAGTNHMFRLFRLPRIIFLSEIANPTPAQGEFGSDIPAGDGKLANLFFTVYVVFIIVHMPHDEYFVILNLYFLPMNYKEVSVRAFSK